MFGRAGVAGGGFDAGAQPGFGAFSDLFDAFFGGSASGGVRRGRPAVGSDLRYDLRITFEESIRGTEKEIEFPVLDRCPTCAGSGAKAGTSSRACPQCGGRGEIRHARQTMLGQMVNVVTCPRCRGEGKVIESPCDDCRGEGRKERTKRLRVSVPAGSTTATRSALRPRGRRAPGRPAGSLYVAITSPPTPSCVARHGAVPRAGALDRPGDAWDDGQGPHRRRRGGPGGEPGTQPGTEIRLRGRGAPNLRRAGARGDLHVLVDVRIPTKLSREQREALEAYAAASGETNVGAGKGGVLDRIKDALG